MVDAKKVLAVCKKYYEDLTATAREKAKVLVVAMNVVKKIEQSDAEES